MDKYNAFMNAIKERKNTFSHKGATVYLTYLPYGTATLIYGVTNYRGEQLASSDQFELWAIISDKVYIVDAYETGAYEMGGVFDSYGALVVEQKTALQEGIAEAVASVKYTEKYSRWQNDPDCKWRVKNTRDDAIQHYLRGESPYQDVVAYLDLESHLTSADYLALGCGVTTIEQMVDRVVHERIDAITSALTINQIAKETVEHIEDYTSDIQRQMADIVRNCGVKTVTVAFEKNGIQAEAKIPTETLLRVVVDNDTFLYWDFTTAVSGKKLMADLGIKSSDLRIGDVISIKTRGINTYERS